MGAYQKCIFFYFIKIINNFVKKLLQLQKDYVIIPSLLSNTHPQAIALVLPNSVDDASFNAVGRTLNMRRKIKNVCYFYETTFGRKI